MLQVILTLHQYNVFLIWLAGLVAGVWGLVLYFRHRTTLHPWRISLIVLLVLGLLQGVLGLSMVLMGQKPGTGTGDYYLHYVYGGIVALGIPLVWLSFTSNGKNIRRDILVYSIAALILVAAGVRAWMTGPHP